MQNIPNFPNKEPNISSSSQEWTDYIEFIIFFNNTIAIAECLRPIFKSSDEIDISGIENEDDNQNNLIDEIVIEIKRREIECKGIYPFILIEGDYVVSLKQDFWNLIIYKFLHFATYLNMKSNRIHNDHDGAKLFEEFSAIIAKKYLGEHSSGGVFGTALPGGFRAKLEAVMLEMGEGKGVIVNTGAKPQDEDIDLIIWKPFHDRRKSMLIAFGQCKTGLSWYNSYVRLQLSTILKTWFVEQPVVDPIPLFFCSMNIPLTRWDYDVKKIGIVFDRLRILGLCSQVDIDANEELFKKINEWVNGVESWLLASNV